MLIFIYFCQNISSRNQQDLILVFVIPLVWRNRSPRFFESSSGILSFRKNDDVRGRKSRGPSVIAPFFLAPTFAIPDHSCLNCEGFARTKDLKDLYLMKNMVMHIVLWPGGAYSIQHCCFIPQCSCAPEDSY